MLFQTIAPMIPTKAIAIYGGNESTKSLNGPDGKPLTGTALTTKAWEADYGDINKLLATPFGQTVQN